MDKVSQYIKQQREVMDMSIEELSQATLISVATLKDIETGRFDKYQGDESYVKMYLKKIAKVLELDADQTRAIIEDYVALTQEFSVAEIKEVQKKQKKENYKKVGEQKRTKPKKPLIQKKQVYEDNVFIRYVKYILVLIICATIVLVIWYSLSKTKSGDNIDYQQPEQTQVDENESEIGRQDEEESDEPQEAEIVPDPYTITNINESDFEIAGYKPGEQVEIEVTFGVQSAFNIWQSNSQVSGVYRVYEAGEIYTFVTTYEAEISYLFNIWNTENLKIKINGIELIYDANTITYIDGVAYFTFVLKGE